MRGNVKYILLLLLITVGFGFSFILIKELMNANYPVFLLLALRFIIGTGTLAAVKLVRPHPVTRKDILCGGLVGFFILMGFIFQTLGLAYTTPAKSGLYTGLFIIFVPIITMIIRHKFLVTPLLVSIFCFMGVALISNVFSVPTYNMGDFLTTLCAFSFAFQFIFLEKYSPTLNPVNFTIIQLLIVALVSLIISLCTEIDRYSILKLDKYFLIIVFLGFVATGISFLIQTYVQSKISANTVAVVSCMESVFALMFSLIFGYAELS